MAAEEEGKTEEPTARRLNEAREKGSVAPNMDLQQAATLFVGCLALRWAGGSVTGSLRDLMVECFRAIPTWRPGSDDLSAWGFPAMRFLAGILLPLAVPVMATSVAVSILCAGWMFNLGTVAPDPSKAFRFSLSRLFGGKAIVELAKALVRMAAVGAIGFHVVWAHRGAFLEMASWPFQQQVTASVSIGFEAIMKMAVVLLVLGIADFLYQRRNWKNDLKMSKQEVKDEARQSEGDPNVKGRIRSLRREMHKRTMMRDVPTATVVVTNPTHYAVALRYRSGEDRAPVVVAKGADLVAKRIREIARESGVPLVENPPLARALHAQAEPGDEIPSDLYAAVAELLAMVLRMPRPKPERRSVAPALAALALVLGPLLLGACTWPLQSKDASMSIALQSTNGNTYYGGDLVVKAVLKNYGRDSAALGWGFGKATLISRGIVRDADSNIVQDTAVLRWDTLPDTSGHDTLRYYLSRQQVGELDMKVGNVLPHLDSIVEGTSLDLSASRTILPRSDTFVVAVHPGENALLRFRWHDPDKNWPIRWDEGIPAGLGSAGTLSWYSSVPGDTVLQWKAPTDTIVDTSVTIWLSDGLGVGKYAWHLRLCSYREQGSVWAGTRTQLTKVALTRNSRPVVVHSMHGFSEIVSLAIDPVREGGTLLAVDRGASQVRKWTSTGIRRVLTDSVLKNGRTAACDVDGAYCWAGGADTGGSRGVLKRLDGSSLVFKSLPGPIQAVEVAQTGWNRAWFVSADSGFLARTTNGVLDTIVRDVLKRPLSLSWDASTALLWVADIGAASVVAFDSTGAVVRRITSLYRPVSVSASGGKIWVADLGDPAGSGTGSVVRFSTLGAVEATATSVNGPRSVVVDPVDANRAWVADTENGRLVLFDGATELSSTPGLDRPDVIAVHRGGP